LHNSNKQHLILAKFYIINAPFIGNQNAKFQLNLPKQITATVVFEWPPQNTPVSVFVVLWMTQKT